MDSILKQFPLRLLIDTEDVSHLIGDGLTFSNVDPGGYEAASIPIPRDVPEAIVGQNVRLECGLGVAWEGRVSQIQRSLGARTTIACEGYGALLKEPNLAQIFVDRDMTRWLPMSVARRLSMSSTYAVSDPSAQTDATSGQPALMTSFSGPSGPTYYPLSMAVYDANGILLASVEYSWTKGTTIDITDTNWGWEVAGQSDANGTFVNGTGNIRGNGPGQGVLSGFGTSVDFLVCDLFYFGHNALTNTEYQIFWTVLAAFGNHGLTKRGSQSATTAHGFYTSDIAGWVIDQIADIQSGITPDATAFIVPHSVYLTGTPGETIIDDMAKLAGWHWGVWESLTALLGDQRPRLDFRPYPSSYTAYCARRDFESFDLNEQLSSLYDTAVVTYTDVVGIQRSVTVTAPNPRLTAAGLSGRTIELTAGTMDSAAATTFGSTVLALLYQQARIAGSGVLLGKVGRPAAAPNVPASEPTGDIPAYMLKAGLDRLRVTDLPGSIDAWGSESEAPISRVECAIGSDGIKTTVELGTGANLIETLQARLAEVASVLGF